MSNRTLVGLGRTVAVVGAVFSGFALSMIFSLGAPDVLLTEGGTFLLFSTFFAVVVWLVLPRQPRNPVTWILVATAFFAGLYIAAWSVAGVVTGDGAFLSADFLYIPADHARSLAWILLTIIPVSSGVIVTQMTFGLLLFPDGKLPSPRWRWAGIFSAFAVGLVMLSTVWMFRPWSTEPAEGGGPLDLISTSVLLIAALLALIALFGRFRRSSGTIRQQIKWVLWGSSVLVLSLAVLTPLQGTVYQDLGLALFVVAGGVFVASYGIALSKYRLYDIDVVISRTVVYGTLAVVITGLYIAAVLGLSSLIGTDPESSPLLAIGATALVAFAFEPLRGRLQRLANRLVYGKRATPYEVLSDFSRNITASDEELLHQVARSLAEGTTAAGAAVWMRQDGILTRVAVWPESDEDSAIVAKGVDVPEGDMTRSVIHDGEVLGVLSLTADRGQTLLPTDERLLEQVASGMGLALRNMGLSLDLRQHVDELRRSRGRLLTVQDETRRHLERELHDGAQQRLVALKLKLTLARRQAQDAGVGEVAGLLDDVALDTDRAIDSLRDFARGIYPPLLEAEGPGAALTSQIRKLPIQVTIHAVGVGRHERPIEAAVYFCVLEALQNVVKHAGASSAHVSIHESGGSVTFEVSDDGVGFDTASAVSGSGLANLGDRLDALDGALEVISSSGMGTTVRGTIPTRELELAP